MKACEVKLRTSPRMRLPDLPCTIQGEDPVTVMLSTPARAITPGQAVVVYSGDEVVMGGWIRKAINQ